MSHELRPIRTDKDYRAALEAAEEFFDAPQGPDPDSEAGAYLEALVTLTEAYDRNLHQELAIPAEVLIR